jgi:hypothetical protein
MSKFDLLRHVPAVITLCLLMMPMVVLGQKDERGAPPGVPDPQQTPGEAGGHGHRESGAHAYGDGQRITSQYSGAMGRATR